MKLNVTYRVFLAILAANAIIVLCMFLIMQWSMDRGFLKYVNQLEQNRMGRLVEKLGRSYSAFGTWDFLKNDPDAISRLLSETYAEDPTQSPSFPVAGDAKRELLIQPEPSARRRYYRLERRIVLLDANRGPVFGSSSPADIAIFKPVVVKGKIVGYMGLLPNKFLSEIHQLRFVKEQKLVFALIALAMLIVAAVISL